MALRSLKDIGPAVFLDMARFASQYLSAGGDIPEGQLAFQLFYSYLLPQYEGSPPRKAGTCSTGCFSDNRIAVPGTACQHARQGKSSASPCSLSP